MLSDLRSIARRRKALGITQKKLASAANISQSLVTKIERGIVIPNYEIAGRIFAFLEAEERKGEKLARDVMYKGVISLAPSDRIAKAVSLAKKYAISQFPVVHEKTMVGSLTTKGMIGVPKNALVKDFLEEAFPSVNVNEGTPASSVSSLLKHHPAVVVLKSGSKVGIITAEDLL